MPKASKKSEGSITSVAKVENCQEDGTPRAAKFTEAASMQIVDLYLKHEPYLSGKHCKQTPAAKKKQIWEDIASAVNTTSTVKRTWEQVRKRFYDVKKSVRHKRLHSQKVPCGTGSDPSLNISFRPFEVKLSSFINSANLHDVGETDSAALEECACTVPALTKTQAKKDGGFANNWSFEQTEDIEGDVERDEANLLNVDDIDGVNSSFEEPKSKQLRQEAVRADSLKTYEKRAKCLNLRNLKGNAIGLNMLGTSKKIGDNNQNISASPGTVLHGRRFHHANSQLPAMKTAAQRKEYPPHIQKIEDDHIRLPRTHILDNDVDSKEELDVDSGCEIKRRVVQKRRCEAFAGSLSSPAMKTAFNHLDLGQKKYDSEQSECLSRCPACGKENGSQTKCHNCPNSQKHSRQSITFNELSGPLSRPAIHQNSAMHKPLSTGLNANNFYGSNIATVPVDILLNHELGRNLLPTNGKVGLSDDLHKHARTIKLRGIRPEMNDPIVLSSDDEDDDDSSSGSNRVESTSPRPADSACSSPAPSSGKVEAAFKENTSKVEQRLSSIAADTECTVALPRKARMKDQFGNTVACVPVKRRKVAQQETAPKSIYDSFIVNCNRMMIGSMIVDLAEPVIFGLDEIYIKINKYGRDVQEIRLRTSELSKCDWCNAPKLPLIYLQTVPVACQSLRSQLNMSREKGNHWYDCKAANLREKFIILHFDNPLEKQEIAIFEKVIGDIGIRNKIPDFLTQMNFHDADSRLGEITNSYKEHFLKQCMQKDSTMKNVAPDSRKLRSSISPFKFFDDEDESGESHSVFIGPIVKLIVYPPPPAKGGISVTNEDLHCLNEGEFLNDVIIDFYLKYLVLEKLRKDADRIHMFSSFFYKRLNQRERRNLHETANLSLQQRRHGRVKTWTRHVDIFQKDYIFVPLNEAAHWFLAVICFPGLTEPEYKPNPHYQGPVDTPTCTTEEDNGVASQDESSALEEAPLPKQSAKKTPCKKQILVPTEPSSENEECDPPRTRKSPCRLKRALRNEEEENCEAEEADTQQSPVDALKKVEICNQNENKTPVKATDALDSLRLSYSDDPGDSSKTTDDQFIDFSEDQDDLDESSEDGAMADEAFSDSGKWHLKPLNCKQPCILLMDSLRGPSRSNVVRTLREYLEVEWEVRKGSKRSFSKEYMKGSNPRVPQQNNFSDCGVYILQYVESFFENPIPSFDLPMNLTDWFPEQRMKTKREEIRNLILNLQELQNKDKKGQKDLDSTTPPATPQEETDELITQDSTH